MPTYQYACTVCGEQLEVVQKFSDEPLTECPSCQGRLRKVFSAVGIVFKGSGFYRTDSRSSGSSSSVPAASSSGDSAKKSADSGATSGDSGGKSGDSGAKAPAAATPSTTTGSTAAA